MELCFLLSDASVGHGHQLIRSITESSYPVIVFAKDFENLEELLHRFPGVIWIVLDINRNLDTFVKFMRVIPTPNYVVNFTGPHSQFLQKCLEVLQTSGNSFKERERGHSELTLDEIVDDHDGTECRILVNVVEKRSDLKKKSKSLAKNFGNLVKGATKKLSTLTHDEDDDNAQEKEPLIRPVRSQQEESKGFFASVLSLCCPCFASSPEPEYCFQSRQDLHYQMRSEQFEEIDKTFKQLHEASLSKWKITLLELQRKESQKIKELQTKVDDLREQEEQELTQVKEKQNFNTRDRLSTVLSAETIRRIEESRSRQTKGTVKYDADRAFREGQILITKQVAIDKAQLHESHYLKLVQEQLQKLTSIQVKYQKKSSALQERYFGTL